eukprot:TRINITY_DN3827_c0_g1_i1.p1 TRINITY_DN3827_c0_g1~~TRINITY_DN3827_c0_g1_i1.p1  ORF type:complete len:500 (-),score=123.69 TRINITY_DN3827_c0_g1_i1:59-1465(-)
MKAAAVVLVCLIAAATSARGDGAARVCMTARAARALQATSLSWDRPKAASDCASGVAATVYAPNEAELFAELKQAGVRFTPVTIEYPLEEEESGRFARTDNGELAFTHHDNNAVQSFLQSVCEQFPEITRLHTIGHSVNGLPLLVLQISANPDVNEPEPKLKLIANMHGDEVVGREVILHLIDYLTREYAANESVAREIIDHTDLYLMPTMNPDGYASRSRYNARRVDLNRNYPDTLRTSTVARAPETQAVMDFTAAHRFSLSAVFHGGALVANYGYDANADDTSVYARAPDDAFFRLAAHTYADAHTTMHSSIEFIGGITNGCEWYPLYGGNQDWCYIQQDDMDLTLEISENKWPAASELPAFWSHNRGAVLAFLQLALQKGLVGTVTDAQTGAPLKASVVVNEIGKPISTDSANGFYQRLLAAGTYTVKATAEGYADSEARQVALLANQRVPVRFDFHLHRKAVPS